MSETEVRTTAAIICQSTDISLYHS